MDGYYNEEKGVLCISIRNIPELNKLLEKAENEVRQLSDTISRLKRFDLEVAFSAPDARQTAGGNMVSIPEEQRVCGIGNGDSAVAYRYAVLRDAMEEM